jgi:hypothetical protein
MVSKQNFRSITVKHFAMLTPHEKICFILTLWRPNNFTPIHCLIGSVGQPLAFRLGGSSLHAGGAPTLLELGSPFSDVLQHW